MRAGIFKPGQRTGSKDAYRPKVHLREQLELYSIMLPVLVFIAIFCYVPMYGIVIAFQNYFPGAPFIGPNVEWVGLKHFIQFITSRTFGRLIRNTLVLSGLNLAFGFWIPILFALLLNEVRWPRWKKLVQTASYMPYFISSVVIAGMVISFIDTGGLINQLRNMLGLDTIAYYTSAKAFPALYTFTQIWRSFGWNSILYLSAMSSIDPGLYESAKIDGAGHLKRMWHITLPMIRPTIMLLFIFAVGGILSADTDMVLLLYNPATYETADVIGTFVYREGMLGGKFSYGTAVGLFMSIISFGMVYTANRLARKVSDYSIW